MYKEKEKNTLSSMYRNLKKIELLRYQLLRNQFTSTASAFNITYLY